MRSEAAGTGGWWSDVDGELLRVLESKPVADVDELAAKLGMPPRAIASCLALLAAEGKVRIRLVERADPRPPLS